MKLGIVVAIALVGCTHPQPLPPEPIHIITIADASVDAGRTVEEQACTVLRELSCPEGYPDASIDVCVGKLRAIGSDFDDVCVAAVRSSDQLARCAVRCVP